MKNSLMILPSKDCSNIHLLRIPEDIEQHEAYRQVVGLIASIEENESDYDWEDISDLLEENGFEAVEFIMGPTLDQGQQVYEELV